MHPIQFWLSFFPDPAWRRSLNLLADWGVGYRTALSYFPELIQSFDVESNNILKCSIAFVVEAQW